MGIVALGDLLTEGVEYRVSNFGVFTVGNGHCIVGYCWFLEIELYKLSYDALGALKNRDH